MGNYSPKEALKKLRNALTEYQTHLYKDLDPAQQVVFLETKIKKAKKIADDAATAYDRAIQGNNHKDRQTVLNDLQKAAETARENLEVLQKQLDNAKQAKLDAEANVAKQSNTPRAKLATEKLNVIEQLIKALPSKKSLTKLNNAEDVKKSFENFATTLTISINTMSQIRRNGSFTDSDTTVAFLKGLAIILTGVVPGLIAYGVMQYCGFFNATGKNVANAMQDTLGNIVLPAPAA